MPLKPPLNIFRYSQFCAPRTPSAAHTPRKDPSHDTTKVAFLLDTEQMFTPSRAMRHAPKHLLPLGPLSALIAVVFFSINDATIKFLSGDYALHQIVLIRSLIGLAILLAIIVPLQGGFGVLRTNRLGMHMLRGFCVVAANTTFFLGLAVLPLADAVAVFFVSPLLITAFSALLLGEQIGPRRLIAVALGMLGVLIMVRPGAEGFNAALMLPILAAVAYALLHVLTRKIGSTESAATMSVYIQLVFVVVSATVGATLGHGKAAAATCCNSCCAHGTCPPPQTGPCWC